MDDTQTTPSTANTEPVTPAAPTPQATYSNTPSSDDEPRNFLVTFLLAAGYGGFLGLRNFYLGQKTIGFVRLGLFLGGYATIFFATLARIGTLIFVGFLLLAIAYIWAAVDFFVVYLSVKTDAKGKPLTRTNRDAKWAKVFFLITVITISIVFVMGVIAGIMGESALRNITDNQESIDTLNTSPGLNDYDYRFDSNNSYDFRTQ